MEYFKFILYGLIQGLTEFIPVSSTAHLKVISLYFGIDDPGPSLSAIIQFGSVLALVWYFKKDFFKLGIKSSGDFYDYLLTGKKPKDQKLQLDDVIFIPRRLKTVTIEGGINRNGIYELKPKENLSDLVIIAGDLKVTAYLDRAQIDRVVPFENRE